MIPDWLTGGGATSEADTERDGFASYSAEVHAIGHGLYDGLTSLKPWADSLPDYDDVQKEPHYYKGAYVAGTAFQLLFIVAVGMVAPGLIL